VLTVREDDLAPNPGSWDSAATKVQVAIALKGGTTIDTLGATADSGYTAEMRINLRELGYAAGRGDGVLFMARRCMTEIPLLPLPIATERGHGL
jgi:hypothetical protein